MKNFIKKLSNIFNNNVINKPGETPSLEKQLNFKNILTRRPFNSYSFSIERQIDKILSDKKDSTGEELVKLVVTLFEKMGYKAFNNDGLKDNKKDVLVYKDNPNEPYLVIQCKSNSPQTNNSRITGDMVANFVGSTVNYNERRIYITSSYYDNSAVNKHSQNVFLIDRIGLIHLLYQYFPLETINVLNSYSLHQLEYDCIKCGHGKLQKVQYPKNSIYKCTNCTARYDSKSTPPKFQKLDNFKPTTDN